MYKVSVLGFDTEITTARVATASQEQVTSRRTEHTVADTGALFTRLGFRMKLGACGLVLLAILGLFTSAELVLEKGELKETQEDSGSRIVGFGQALGYHNNNKIHTINTENQAAKSKIIKDWNKAFSKHFGGKRSIFGSAKQPNPSTQTQGGYSRKWTKEFGKLFGGQKLTRGDYSLVTAGGMQQGDARRPKSKLLQKWNKAYEKYFGKKKNKYHEQWSQKYDKLFG